MSFDPPSHHPHPPLCFALTDSIPAPIWFITLQVWHFPSPATFPPCVPLLLCCCLDAFKGEESRVHWQTELLQGLCPFMGVEEVTEEQKGQRRDRDDIFAVSKLVFYGPRSIRSDHVHIKTCHIRPSQWESNQIWWCMLLNSLFWCLNQLNKYSQWTVQRNTCKSRWPRCSCSGQLLSLSSTLQF